MNVSPFCSTVPFPPLPPYLHLPALLLPLLGRLLGAGGVDRFPEGLVHLGPVLVRLVLGLAGQLVPTHLW